MPINIPSGVDVSVQENLVNVSGPKGKLEKQFSKLAQITVEDNVVTVTPVEDTRPARAMYGTARSIISNMVDGVVNSYSKDLLIEGVGFRAAVKGNLVDLELGYSHPIEYTIPEGVSVTVSDNVKIHVEGPDKQKVGQVAANIRAYRPPEPYKGKGVRYADEHIIRKEAKKS